MAKIIKQMTADAGKDAGKGDTYSFLLEMKTDTASMEISSTFIREASLIKTEIHDSTVCRDWSTLESSAPNGILWSHPLLQTQGSVQKKWEDCKSQK